MPDEIPPPIQALVDATNAADSDAFVALFTEDAYIEDYGRKFHGQGGAASWNETDNIGVGAHFELHSVRAGAEPGDFLVDITVRSRRFNGDGTLDTSIRDGRISRLVTG
jgi:hypothetical protein